MRFLAAAAAVIVLSWPAAGSGAEPSDLDEVVRLACEEDMSIMSFGPGHLRESCRMEFVHQGTWCEVAYWSERQEEVIHVRRDGRPTKLVEVDRYITFSIIELWQFEADGQWPVREHYLSVRATTGGRSLGATFTGEVNVGMVGHALNGGYEMKDIEQRFSAEEEAGREHKAFWQVRLDRVVRATLIAKGEAPLLASEAPVTEKRRSGIRVSETSVP